MASLINESESSKVDGTKYEPNLIDIEHLSRRFHYLNGFVIPQFAFDKINDLESFELRSSDVWIASYPKSGTTWLQEIVYLIETNCDYEKAKLKTLEERSPFYEFTTTSLDYMNNLESPRIFKTHLPIQFLPENIENKCKVIYVLRNPKDVVVSLHHFFKMKTDTRFQGTLKDLTKIFLKGKSPYGPWWMHVDGYSSHKNVFVASYEDLQKKPKEIVKELCKFLGKDLTDEKIDAIIDWCSFDKMKKNPSVGFELRKKLGLFEKDGNFYRKGKIGDWINHFTPEESIEFEEIIRNNLKFNDLDYGISDEELNEFLKLAADKNSISNSSSSNASLPTNASTDVAPSA